MSNQQQHPQGQSFEQYSQRPQVPPFPEGGHPPIAPKPPKKSTARTVAICLFAGLGAFVVIASAFGAGGSSPETSKPSTVVTTVDNGPTPDPITTPTNKPSAVKPTQPAPKPTKAAPKLTASQEQAIGSAEDYLSTGAFSKSGLIEQLVFEGFSKADAKFAVAHITVNWNEQAALSAKSYLETSHFSRSGLISQLEFEGFTHAQAVYGVNKAGL